MGKLKNNIAQSKGNTLYFTFSIFPINVISNIIPPFCNADSSGWASRIIIYSIVDKIALISLIWTVRSSSDCVIIGWKVFFNRYTISNTKPSRWTNRAIAVRVATYTCKVLDRERSK